MLKAPFSGAFFYTFGFQKIDYEIIKSRASIFIFF